ncbi:MAG: hypothetical protein Q8R92_03235 [Deltaproteobacteria bacterium]|nr:hypothetical protein [Deltaproteobacteria bacterium]
MTRSGTTTALAVLALLAAGCASEPVYLKTGNPSGPPPWRAVLLPVIPASPAEGEEVPDFSYDLLEEVRGCLAMKIPQDAYQLISLPRVDRAIPLSEGPVEGEAEMARAGQALAADLVIQPELFARDRSYYLIQSVARVGMRVKIYDGRTGKLLVESSHEQVRNQGLQKIPVWTGGLVYGPIRGLLHGQMLAICDSVATRIGEDLAKFSDSGLTEAGTAQAEPATN